MNEGGEEEEEEEEEFVHVLYIVAHPKVLVWSE